MNELDEKAAWVLVPRAPTVAMLKAAADCRSRIRGAHDDEATGSDYYHAMLAAAPRTGADLANALIAAAPELLEALERLVSFIDTYVTSESTMRGLSKMPAVQRARDAIAKATHQ